MHIAAYNIAYRCIHSNYNYQHGSCLNNTILSWYSKFGGKVYLEVSELLLLVNKLIVISFKILIVLNIFYNDGTSCRFWMYWNPIYHNMCWSSGYGVIFMLGVRILDRLGLKSITDIFTVQYFHDTVIFTLQCTEWLLCSTAFVEKNFTNFIKLPKTYARSQNTSWSKCVIYPRAICLANLLPCTSKKAVILLLAAALFPKYVTTYERSLKCLFGVTIP